MVTCSLMGGLGNYMFQIATTLSVSIDNSIEYFFNINSVSKAHNHINTYTQNIFRKVKFVEHVLPIENVYAEPFFHYNKISYKNNLLLQGYFQSEKYFKHNTEKIVDLFEIDVSSKKYIEDKYGTLLKNNTCSLHVRRGDYLGLPDFHPSCDIDYYKQAMDFFDDDTLFLISSDDILWCKKNLIKKNIIYLENNIDYLDLWIMSLCKNNIIANSTFSWWSAWLNQNESKKVIAPIKWFGKSLPLNTEDLIPKEWIKI
jgi:hypothetical protein